MGAASISRLRDGNDCATLNLKLVHPASLTHG